MQSYSFLPPAITSAIILIFSLLIAKKISLSPQYRALFILCLNTLWWHSSWAFLFLTQSENLARILAKVGHIGILALPLTFHYFYVTLVGHQSKLLTTKICTYTFFLACLGLTDWIIQGVNIFPWGFYPKAGVFHFIFLLFTTYFLISGLILNYKSMNETTNPLKQKTLKLCQTAGVIYCFGSVDFLANYRISAFYPFGFLFSIIFIIIVSYAVIKFDLFSKEETLLRALEDAQKAQKASEIRLGQLATQVAHDLRSPLAALEVATSLGTFSSEHKVLLTGSIARIREIANELLEEASASQIAIDQVSSSRQPQHPQSAQESIALCELIQNIVDECRLQYRLRSDLNLTFEINDENRTVTAFVQPSEFKRIISNLINNSIEAIEGPGRVSVSLNRDFTSNDRTHSISLRISDNGKGIPPEVLKILGKRGATFGKKQGNGLGLYHAISTVKKWGGDLKIESSVGTGTDVTLTLLPSLKEFHIKK